MSADENMSSGRTLSRSGLAEIYAKGNVGVFWDVVDFPIFIPDPHLISINIKSALKDKGFHCKDRVSIWLYEDEKNRKKQKFIDTCEAAGISINFVPEVAEAYGNARDHKMLVDILRWAVDSPIESNLIVLSNNLKEKLTVSVLRSLHGRGYNVLLAVPTEHIYLLLKAHHGFGIAFFLRWESEAHDKRWKPISSDGVGSSQ